MKKIFGLLVALGILIPSSVQALVPAQMKIFCDYADPVIEFLKKEGYQQLASGLSVQPNGDQKYSVVYFKPDSVLYVLFTTNGLGCFVAEINSNVKLHELEEGPKKDPA